MGDEGIYRDEGGLFTMREEGSEKGTPVGVKDEESMVVLHGNGGC